MKPFYFLVIRILKYYKNLNLGPTHRLGSFLLATQKVPGGTAFLGSDQVQPKEKEISVTLVAILTASIVVAMTFIVVLVMCCRKQRKDLEKQYVNEYQPQGLFQLRTEHISIHQEIQKYAQNDTSCKAVEANAGSEKPLTDGHASFPSSLNSCETHGVSKTAQSVSSEMYLANSRTSLQTTLCQGCPRETSLDCKGRGEHSLPRNTGSLTGVSLSRRVASPSVSTLGSEKKSWDSQSSLDETPSSLDDTPRKTSPQRSRESIV